MKIYRVDFRVGDTLSEYPAGTHLVRAASLSQARDHVMRIVSVKSATPEDIAELAIGDGAIEIEVAGDE